MKLLHGKAAYLTVAVAAALSVAGAAAVQAQPASKSTVTTAKTQVSANSARFGFGPGQALQAKGVYPSPQGTAIRFDRTYRGLKVIGGDFVIHLTPSGAFRYGNGMKVVGLPSSIVPSLRSAAAGAAAAAKVGYAPASKTAALVIYARPHSSQLAWQVNTASKGGLHADVTYVSANSGRVLASWSTIETAKDVGKGKTEFVGTVKMPDTKSGKKYTLVDQTRGGGAMYDAHNVATPGVGTLFEAKNNVWGDHTINDRETAGADAGFSIAKTWDYYLKTYGRQGIADDGKGARGFVHFRVNYNNASWSDGCFCMSFGDGDGVTWGPLVTLDVGGHEMSHGVTSRTAGLIYSQESGGLNESTSDVMGTEVEFFAKNKHDVPDYIIGEQFQIHYDPATQWLRRMDDPHRDGGSANCWYSGVGNLNVHYSSGVGNHAFYLLSEGSGAKTINGIDYNSPTCDGSTVKGIGHVKAAAIRYKALTENWVSTTNYHMAREGMLQAAKDLYGKSSVEYKTTNKAWAAAGVTP
jgi:Zn-dependent metalloprotease